ncbi:DNAJ heat shock N-terminal domain-containing protein [Striga asiatica]|uniref:DNAJ heat shock N-terminal domain-containing protein n=1 Tax=Striga asiatica TaxID=4170 RepID=A0A5A7PCT7_STRAF|nr:DNAJ heat shock N-terminal domain-containing protein [Striga asiatica]
MVPVENKNQTHHELFRWTSYEHHRVKTAPEYLEAQPIAEENTRSRCNNNTPRRNAVPRSLQSSANILVALSASSMLAPDAITAHTIAPADEPASDVNFNVTSSTLNISQTNIIAVSKHKGNRSPAAEKLKPGLVTSLRRRSASTSSTICSHTTSGWTGSSTTAPILSFLRRRHHHSICLSSSANISTAGTSQSSIPSTIDPLFFKIRDAIPRKSSPVAAANDFFSDGGGGGGEAL